MEVDRKLIEDLVRTKILASPRDVNGILSLVLPRLPEAELLNILEILKPCPHSQFDH